MRKILGLSLLSVLMLTSCSQSETSAVFHQYGGRNTNGGGSSLGFHTLRKGETLWTVSKAYHVDLRDLLDLNQYSVPYKTYVGERIKIPAPSNYKVRRGDTLYKVSRMFDTTTTDIARLNNIKAPYKLAAGQTLRLPPKHASPQNIVQTRNIIQSPVSGYTPSEVTPTGIKTQTAQIEREELKPVGNTVSPIVQPTVSAEQVAKSQAASQAATQSATQATPQYAPQPTIVQSMPELNPNGSVKFMKPVAGPIISGYGPKDDGLHNDGINIKANQGDAVRAAETGIVVYQGKQIEGYGNMILIRHAGGYLTAYAHMAKTLVKKGDKVTRGQTIGTVGSSGNVKVPQLHFEIRKGRDAIDPKTILKI